MSNWINKKKNEWLDQQKGFGRSVDYDELSKIEENDEMTPWLQEIITKQSGDIDVKFREVLQSFNMVKYFIDP